MNFKMAVGALVCAYLVCAFSISMWRYLEVLRHLFGTASPSATPLISLPRCKYVAFSQARLRRTTHLVILGHVFDVTQPATARNDRARLPNESANLLSSWFSAILSLSSSLVSLASPAAAPSRPPTIPSSQAVVAQLRHLMGRSAASRDIALAHAHTHAHAHTLSSSQHDSLDGLTSSQIAALFDWLRAANHHFQCVGYSAGPFLSEMGTSTVYLQELKRSVELSLLMRRPANSPPPQSFSFCSSSTDSHDFFVFCGQNRHDRTAISYPRIFREGESGPRCACVLPAHFADARLELYENCAVMQSACKVSYLSQHLPTNF